ncbi:hypothetical protein HWV62_21040 [Athelia sp. TMB]|nr:hypothetical protein HWV62_21040 [Athelia sp. TMB]
MWTMHDSIDQQFDFVSGDVSPRFNFNSEDLNDVHATTHGSTDASSGLVLDYLEPFTQTEFHAAFLCDPRAIPKDMSITPSHEALQAASISRGLMGDTDSQLILQIFTSHKHQCGFELDIGRFQPNGRTPHPSLINAVYLVGYYFSSSPFFAEAEASMLTETHDAISAGIQQSDRLVDVVSASCLLAFYYYVNGQVVEGYRHSFTAVRLAITLGLHQLCTDAYNSSDMYAPIPPVQDIAELRDRIAVFWQVYFLDRAWSVANQLPTALPDVVSSELLKIRTPWPQKIQSLPESSPTFWFFEELDNKPFMPALRVEAVALYERAYRLSTSKSATELLSTIDQQYDLLVSYDKITLAGKRREVEEALDKFASTLPPASGSEAWRSRPTGFDSDLVAIHAMVDAASIYLHKDSSGHFDSLAERCLSAARNITSAARLVKDDDYQYLDPSISACWKEVGELYIYLLFETDKISGRAREMHLFCRELNYLIHALRKLGKVFPIADQHATALERIREERCSRPTGKFI